MSINRKVFKEATLSSNCPECFANNSIRYTVLQKEIDNRWYYHLSRELSEHMVCGKCETVIYPIRYTENIEQIKAFYLRTMGTPPKRFQLKALSYITLILVLTAVAAGVLAWQRPELFTFAP